MKILSTIALLLVIAFVSAGNEGDQFDFEGLNNEIIKPLLEFFFRYIVPLIKSIPSNNPYGEEIGNFITFLKLN